MVSPFPICTFCHCRALRGHRSSCNSEENIRALWCCCSTGAGAVAWGGQAVGVSAALYPGQPGQQTLLRPGDVFRSLFLIGFPKTDQGRCLSLNSLSIPFPHLKKSQQNSEGTDCHLIKSPVWISPTQTCHRSVLRARSQGPPNLYPPVPFPVHTQCRGSKSVRAVAESRNTWVLFIVPCSALGGKRNSEPFGP